LIRVFFRLLFSSATQIGFEDLNECPHLCTLSYDYLKKSVGYEQNLLAFFHNKMNPDALLVQLIEELDKCILGYFSFHWKFATHIITQVLIDPPEKKTVCVAHRPEKSTPLRSSSVLLPPLKLIVYFGFAPRMYPNVFAVHLHI